MQCSPADRYAPCFRAGRRKPGTRFAPGPSLTRWPISDGTLTSGRGYPAARRGLSGYVERCRVGVPLPSWRGPRTGRAAPGNRIAASPGGPDHRRLRLGLGRAVLHQVPGGHRRRGHQDRVPAEARRPTPLSAVSWKRRRERVFGVLRRPELNKKSVLLEMKEPESIEVVKNLLRTADVLVENFRSHVMASWGLSFEEGWRSTRGSSMRPSAGTARRVPTMSVRPAAR